MIKTKNLCRLHEWAAVLLLKNQRQTVSLAARRLTHCLSLIQTSVFTASNPHVSEDFRNLQSSVTGTFLTVCTKDRESTGGKRHLNMLLPHTWNDLKFISLVSMDIFKDVKWLEGGVIWLQIFCLIYFYLWSWSVWTNICRFFWLFDVSSFIIMTWQVLSLDVWLRIVCRKLW